MALSFEAVKVAFKQDKTGFVLTLSIHPDELPTELLRDFVGTRYGVAMARINDDETPKAYDNRVERAGILCRTEDFWHYMRVEDEEEAIAALRHYCGIKSRSELHGNAAAQALFDSLVEAYEKSIPDPF